MARNHNPHKTTLKILVSVGLIATLAFASIGGLAWWAHSFTTSSVKNELSAQKIYFPPKGSPALASPEIGPYLNQYAGQELLTGPQAKAYADHFIAVHLQEVAGGQTYAQVSNASLANPSNTTLKAEAQTLFQGETLRGLLLGDAYSFWTVGYIAQICALVCFLAAGIFGVLTLRGFWHYNSL